ncbi:MAG: dihydroorotate dehydrogenase electron transfer subunit [Bacteroidales bacterium]|nr:dihydroorotate dehydrogenase electron transfer subunit [Bacteroidales bacterium]
MKSGKYLIKSNSEIADRTWKMVLEGDTSALERGGQFVDIAIEGHFLRRPLAATEWDSKRFSVIYKTVGGGTELMSTLEPGATLDVLTGLGNGFDADATLRSALVVCGGLGASPAFTLVKQLLAKGRKVNVVLGFGKASEVVLEDEYRSLGAAVQVVTMDGSRGMKGLVTDAIEQMKPDYDHFYTCGPKVMMKAVCGMLEGPGEASLEERMGCGCGICYGCTCKTKNGPRRVCADGPVFSKEDIIW